MLVITDMASRSEPIVTLRDLQRERNLNGDQLISFTALSDELNQEAFDLIQEQHLAEFEGVEYVIKEVVEKNLGTRSLKEATAVLKIFEDLSVEYWYDTTAGYKGPAQLMAFIVDDTKYSFDVVDIFPTLYFDNFGNDNKLALLQEVLKRFGAEFEVDHFTIRIRKRIGYDSDFQFRYGYNVKAISRKVDSYGLTTYIRGFGQPLKDAEGNETGQYAIEAEYYSPNAEIYGAIHAAPIYDDRVTDLATLEAMMKDAIQDVPIVSIELDFADLRGAGYSHDVPGMGDRVLVIYEPLSNLNVETRITAITEDYDLYLRPIRTKVTLANIRKDITDTLASFNNTTKTVNKVITADGGVVSDVLPQAVKDVTAAIQSAQTEVQFDRGIRLIDTTNPLLRVVLAAAGIGITSDGGATYQTAMTGGGIVANAITSGQLNTNNVKILGDDHFFWDGEYLIAQDPVDTGKYIRLSKNGLEVTNDGGVTFETSVNGDGVVADYIRSTGEIDVETIARVGSELVIGQDWQSSTIKRIRFNGLGGGAGISFNPASDEITIGAPNGVLIEKAHFNDDTYRLGVETGVCGVGGIEGYATSGEIAGVWVTFKHKRYTAPTNITFTTISGTPGVTPQVTNITDEGFWLYINGLNSADAYRYWRGNYSTVD